MREWADITLAARERHGQDFFKKTPQAYFVDNVKASAQGERTAADWWHELRKQEERDRVERNRRKESSNRQHSTADKTGGRFEDDSFMENMFDLFRTAGQSEDLALQNARRCQPKRKK